LGGQVTSAQELPPCRDYSKLSTDPSFELPEPYPTRNTTCIAEKIIDVSTHPKQTKSYTLKDDDEFYHYVGPSTTQNNLGLLGRNSVVDPLFVHGGDHIFVAERVYAESAGGAWIESGWAEVSWRDNEQYVYQFDSSTMTWNLFDQYSLSPGDLVRTLVESIGNDIWVAELYWNGSYHRLAQVDIGFTTASNGYNQAEIYTSVETHPYLPRSVFDANYLYEGNNIWHIWDTSYPTVVYAYTPYAIDMLERYHWFVAYSPPGIFLPIVIK